MNEDVDLSILPPLSYSAVSKFHTCEKQYYEGRVLKNFRDEQGEVALWGERCHKAIEDACKGSNPLPNEFDFLAKTVENINKQVGDKWFELELYLDKDWKVCHKEGRFLTAIIDYLCIHGYKAKLADWKFGKKKPTRQIAFYAACVFAAFPQVTEIDAAFVWFKDGVMTKEKFTRDQFEALKAEFMDTVKPMIRSYEFGNFRPKKSGLCNGWCPVTSCNYWKPKWKN